MPPRILMIAGDPSGDHQAARLAREILRREPDAELYGYGGPEMREAGVRIDFELTALSAIGLFDVLPKVPRGMLAHARLRRALRAHPPDAAVLIDAGAFCLPTAKVLQGLGVPVLGYFPPGSWSGSRKRARKVAACYTAVATPFPQPIPAYREFGLEHELVGHPLVEELAPLLEARSPAVAEPPTLALLPGSRAQEIRHILPPMLGAAGILRQCQPELRVVVSRAPSVPTALFDAVVRRSGVAVEVAEGSRETLASATAAIVKSGTVALEATLLEVPMAVVYKISVAAYLVASLYYFPRPRLWAMANIVAGELIVPQLFQFKCTPALLSAELAPLMSDTPARRRMIDRLRQARESLAGGDAPAKTADLLFRLLSRGSAAPA
jgi:lipid-A-disaccharide synthase